jgi:hypothetical protein
MADLKALSVRHVGQFKAFAGEMYSKRVSISGALSSPLDSTAVRENRTGWRLRIGFPAKTGK